MKRVYGANQLGYSWIGTMSRNIFWRVEWYLGLGFSEADPEKRTWVPVVYLGSDAGNTWKWNGEVKKGRKLAKKALLNKPSMTVGNKLHSAGELREPVKRMHIKVFLPRARELGYVFTKSHWSWLEDWSWGQSFFSTLAQVAKWQPWKPSHRDRGAVSRKLARVRCVVRLRGCGWVTGSVCFCPRPLCLPLVGASASSEPS